MSSEIVMGHEITVYDAGSESFDRYTIVFLDFERERNGMYQMVGSSEEPTQPHGFWQHTSGQVGSHLGKRIRFSQLPRQVQILVKSELED